MLRGDGQLSAVLRAALSDSVQLDDRGVFRRR
jgi:hypothetical protein